MKKLKERVVVAANPFFPFMELKPNVILIERALPGDTPTSLGKAKLEKKIIFSLKKRGEKYIIFAE